MQQQFQGSNESSKGNRGPFLPHPQLEALRREGIELLGLLNRSSSDVTGSAPKTVDRLRAELFHGELPGFHVVCPKCYYAMEVRYCTHCSQALSKIGNELTCERCQTQGHRLPCYFCIHCGHDLQDAPPYEAGGVVVEEPTHWSDPGLI